MDEFSFFRNLKIENSKQTNDGMKQSQAKFQVEKQHKESLKNHKDKKINSENGVIRLMHVMSPKEELTKGAFSKEKQSCSVLKTKQFINSNSLLRENRTEIEKQDLSFNKYYSKSNIKSIEEEK
jgi:DNA replicative helicase MCM subunit Mcm2 (Cdc46/Mcm family)